MVIKNNPNPVVDPLKSTNVVYEFKCPMPQCRVANYIGKTTTTLSRRLTMHKQQGNIRNHFLDSHGYPPTREQLVENTNIILKEENPSKLLISEALLILQKNPFLNIQSDYFNDILKLFYSSQVSKPAPHQQLKTVPVDINKIPLHHK